MIVVSLEGDVGLGECLLAMIGLAEELFKVSDALLLALAVCALGGSVLSPATLRGPVLAT